MDFAAVIQRLNSLGVDQVQPGLDRMVAACARLGHPEQIFKSVHVAGTNGKGSTIAFLESILRSSGYSVGKYTSPHLHDIRERITTNGKMISENEFVAAHQEVRAKCADVGLSYFETLTLMAFAYFRAHPVDIVLLETGLGGRWDATNVVLPMVSVITTIDYDHQAYLGETLSQIATEKCGILKKGVPAVIAPQASEAMDVIQATVAELGIHAQVVQPLAADIPLGLTGDHQRQNAALAVAAARIVKSLVTPGLTRGPEVLDSRLRGNDELDALATTRWPGRLEWLSQDPPILCDVAHNPGGMRVLTNYIRTMVSAHDEEQTATGGSEGLSPSRAPVPRLAVRDGDPCERGRHPSVTGPVAVCDRGVSADITVVLGIMKDKDAVGMVRELATIADIFYCVAPDTPRALPAEDLAQIVRAVGKKAIVTTIADVKRDWKGLGLLVVTGSFYTVGEFCK